MQKINVDTDSSGLPKHLLTPQEVAKYFKVSKGTIDRWTRLKKYGLPGMKIGRKVLYQPASIQRWLNEKEQQLN
ncbi:MAG: helix-turn-helix domain-containing protein [Bacteroidales bacterium]|nr:helix-turn-helix domain-containing protein [Bacteroidales bacterium]